MKFSLTIITALVVILLSAYSIDGASLNDRPIIGILTQPSSASMRQFGDKYIAASYVKYVESGGARVVPIHHDAPFDVLQQTFNNINGILFPGGGSDLDNTTLFYAGQYLYNLTLQANNRGDYMVLFGHCMGFELLSMITSQNNSILSPVDAENYTIPLNFTLRARGSRMFKNAPPNVIHTLDSEPVTMNNHQWGVTPSSFYANAYLPKFYDVLSLNNDREGVTFVSSMEGYQYPVYGLQWHPEKNQFEWDPDEVINHSPDAITAMEYMSSFFVNEARKSQHTYPSQDAENAALIYNYSPVFTALYGSSFEQCYFFPKWSSNMTSLVQ